MAHVGKGKIHSLIAEIRASLAVSTIEDVQPLRVDLYGVDMTRDCNNDLQTYISYIISRRNKLKFLNSEVPENELIHIFVKGLSPIFQPLQVHFAIPNTLPDKFDAVVSIVRKFSNSPAVARNSPSIVWLQPMCLSQHLFQLHLKRRQYIVDFLLTGIMPLWRQMQILSWWCERAKPAAVFTRSHTYSHCLPLLQKERTHSKHL